MQLRSYYFAVFIMVMLKLSFTEDSSGTGPGCHRVQRMVDFRRDLNFTFILAPNEVDIGDCKGHCTINGNPWSESQSYYNILSLLQNQPPLSCCVPIEFQPVQVVISLYSEVTNKFSTRTDKLDDAVVTRCGCRSLPTVCDSAMYSMP